MDIQYEVIIIGAGPAGLTAAIYASRANLKTLLVEGDAPGGKLIKTYEIENYPGVRKSSGVDLAISLMNHGMAFGAAMEVGNVVEIKSCDGFHTVVLESGKSFTANAVIIASGTKERQLPVENAQKYTGHGISYCAVCDGTFYRNQDVCVIGGGNSALEESLYLADLVKKVNIIIRRNVFRAEADIQERVKKNDKINIIVNSIPESLKIENDKIIGLNIKNILTNEIQTISCTGIFPYIGADPATKFCPKEMLNERGYIKVNPNMSTIINGIYAAGDVIDKQLRQVVTATSDGAIAANSVINYLHNSSK